MKITRKQLRRLIQEALGDRIPIFPGGPVTQDEIESLRQAGRENADLSNLNQNQLRNLKNLEAGDDESINQSRIVYQSFGSEEPDITVEEEENFLISQIGFELAPFLGTGVYSIQPELLKKFRKSLDYSQEVWFMSSEATPSDHSIRWLKTAEDKMDNQKYSMLEKLKDGTYSIYGWNPTGARPLIEYGLLPGEQEEIEEAIYKGLTEDIPVSYALYRAILHFQPNVYTRSAM